MNINTYKSSSQSGGPSLKRRVVPRSIEEIFSPNREGFIQKFILFNQIHIPEKCKNLCFKVIVKAMGILKFGIQVQSFIWDVLKMLWALSDSSKVLMRKYVRQTILFAK